MSRDEYQRTVAQQAQQAQQAQNNVLSLYGGGLSGLSQQMMQALNAAQLAGMQGMHYPGGVQQAPVPRADMRVCDLVGWRCWRITAAGYLQSAAVANIWMPGEAMDGEVTDHAGGGVHAYKTRADALGHSMTVSRHAWGSVLLWGEVVEHERGYRAEHARVLSIDDIAWDGEPPWSERLRDALDFLRGRYGVEVS